MELTLLSEQIFMNFKNIITSVILIYVNGHVFPSILIKRGARGEG